MLCFFFQAEDGIRDADVTGVQTCALPIYSKAKNNYHINFTAKENSNIKYLLIAALNSEDALLNHKFMVERFANLEIMAGLVRSEERSVGKECRSRWLREY